MRTHTISILVASFVLVLAGLSPGPARAQTDSPQPAVQDSSSKPIGKVVTATGSITIEHASAVVVQANISGQASQTKVGDVVYLGDVVQTGADGRVGINFTDGTSFKLSGNARMALTEFVYDPNGKSNSSLLSLTKGTFTFVAGNIAKTGDMKVDTPVATVGIRAPRRTSKYRMMGQSSLRHLLKRARASLRKKSPGHARRSNPSKKPIARSISISVEGARARSGTVPGGFPKGSCPVKDCHDGSTKSRRAPGSSLEREPFSVRAEIRHRAATCRNQRPHIPKIGTPDMEIRAKTGTIDSLAPIYLLLLGSPAAAQNPKPKDSYIKNIEACNGLDRASFEARIAGCTALIDEHQVTTTTALATAYSNRGNAYAAKRDYDRAIQDFDQSIKLYPTYSKPFNNSGVAYLKKGEYDLAIEAFDQAIRLNRNYGEAFANRAGAYLKKNEYARAARDYDEAIRIEPDLQGVWNGRCWTRAILGALQAALADRNKAI